MTSSWNPAKVKAFRAELMRFLGHVVINSKERSEMILGDHIYTAQTMLLDGIFDGLANDIHDFKVGKSRQLGVSTLSRALTLFWAGVHPGMRGYMVLDTAQHMEEARAELMQMIDNLPPRLGFPVVKRQNRYQLVLSNNTIINFAAAGVKKSSSSGTLGRGSGVNFVHASEVSSWSDEEQYEAFRNAMAQDYPDRFYLWETTARGYNLWHTIWQNALEDTNHQKTIFLGWWAKDNQRIDRSDADFEKYGLEPPTPKEAKRIEAVKRQYNVFITPEQLAWFRRQMDPKINSLSSDASALDEDPLRLQENPWTEQEMFQQSGATFFDPERLTLQEEQNVESPKSVWSYSPGTEFPECRVRRAHNARSIELKIWSEPEDGAAYVIGADPAHGANEHNDRGAIQICRAYADGLDQVAEYAWPLIHTKQFAWVIASLFGYYGADVNQVYFCLELNGPGNAVLDELNSLKRQLAVGYFGDTAQDLGIQNIFRNVRNYLHTRPDSVVNGTNTIHWTTNRRNKVEIMERLRDFANNGMLRLRSGELISEMNTVTRDGDSISAAGSGKDDRVMAMALAVRVWEERARRGLIGLRRTREAELARKTMTLRDQVKIFNGAQMESFFAMKSRERSLAAALARKAQWKAR